MIPNNTPKNAYLDRTAAFLPNAPVGNDAIEAILGMADEPPSRVRRMTLRSNGIQTRYYAIDPDSRRAAHTNAKLAAEAIRQLFVQGIKLEDTTSLSYVTSYPDQTMPGHGVMVHGLLDMPSCEVLSITGVCAADMTAMKHAYNAIRTGEHAHTVAAASENASAVMRDEVFQHETDHKKLENASPEISFEKDFLRWMLSNGAGAACLSSRPNSDGLSLKIRWIELLSYASEMPSCTYTGAEFRDGVFEGWKHADPEYSCRHSLMTARQDVKLLNGNIVRYTVEKPLTQVVIKHDIRTDEIDWFLPHYSSGFSRDRLSDGLKNIDFEIPQEKWLANLYTKGNTGSASIYIILEEFMCTLSLERGQKVSCYVPESERFSTCFMLLEAV